MMRRITAFLAAVATLGTSWAMGMAMAEPAPPRLVLSDVGASTSTPISVDDMYPGLAVTRPYVVALTSTAPDALLALEVDELADLERDCNRPETNSGDTTCEEFGGELSQQLLLSAVLTADNDCEDATGATQVLAPTLLADLAASGAIGADELIVSGAARCLLLTFDLPWAADNLVQTDLARFDLTVHAEQALPDQDVAGAQERPDGLQGVLGAADHRGVLPAAGLAVGALLALGGGGVTAGTWVVRKAGRRERS